MTGEVVGIRDPKPGDSSAHYWDESSKALAAGIDRALPERRNLLLQVSADETKDLLLSRGNGIPGEFYIGDRKTGSLAMLAEQHRDLDPDRLPRKKPL